MGDTFFTAAFNYRISNVLRTRIQRLDKVRVYSTSRLWWLRAGAKCQSPTTIHETAQYFLINETKESRIQMVPTKGHERLAIACLQLLRSASQRPWRLILKHMEDSCISTLARTNDLSATLNEKQPLLIYASESWAYHLSFATTSSHLLQTVYEFLERDCFTWIDTSASSGDLKNLIKRAQHLKKFAKRAEKMLAEATSAELQSDDVEDLKLWAVDLNRLVGSNLVLSPSSIYKPVPPFCPDDSMIRKSSGKAKTSYSVTGTISTRIYQLALMTPPPNWWQLVICLQLWYSRHIALQFRTPRLVRRFGKPNMMNT